MGKWQRTILRLLGLALLVLGLGVAAPTRAAAEVGAPVTVDTIPSCGQGTSGSSLLHLDQPIAQAYIRVPQAAAGHNYQLFVQNFGGTASCTPAAPIELSDTKWHPLNLPNLAAGDYILNLDSPYYQGAQVANKPEIMFLQAGAPCIPDADCQVRYADKPATLTGQFLSLPSDSLIVTQIAPLGSPIKQVNYFVDSQFAYHLSDLKAFDEHYIPPGNHTLTRQIVFESGQTLLLPADQPSSTTAWGSLNRVFWYYFLRYREGIVVAGLLFTLVVVFFGARLLRAIFQIKHLDQRAHTAPEARTGVGHYLPLEEQARQSDAGFRRYYVTHLLVLVGRWALRLAIFLGIVLLLFRFVITTFGVSGISMEPTLHDRDSMLISQLGRTWADMGGRPYLPHRFAIIVFKHTTGFAGESDFLVKRVYGLPGERVVVHAGKVVIYNAEHPTGFTPDGGKYWMLPSTDGDLDVVVQPGEVFVLGDNRPESIDSRVFGAVSSDQIIGEVVARFAPIATLKLILGQ